jgi:hypothetical protein
VRVRTNYRKETVYLYRLNSSPDNERRLLMVYLKRINELADRPEFYHLLSNSCTINPFCDGFFSADPAAPTGGRVGAVISWRAHDRAALWL